MHFFSSVPARRPPHRRNAVAERPAPRPSVLTHWYGHGGAEVGLRATPVAGWRSTLSLWALSLDSELLFVGDAGITEPSAASRRSGVTWANFYRALRQLALDWDVSLARARFSDEAPDEDRIPGALENVVAAGVTWSPVSRGPFGAFRLRHFGSYPLIEDNSVRASGTTLFNADAGWLFAPGLRLQVSLLNVFDVRDFDIHPVEPRQVRVSLGWGF